MLFMGAYFNGFGHTAGSNYGGDEGPGGLHVGKEKEKPGTLLRLA
jgi:hypothetical protein